MFYAQIRICYKTWNFEKQTDPLIPTRRPDLVLINKISKWINKKQMSSSGFCCSSWFTK